MVVYQLLQQDRPQILVLGVLRDHYLPLRHDLQLLTVKIPQAHSPVRQQVHLMVRSLALLQLLQLQYAQVCSLEQQKIPKRARQKPHLKPVVPQLNYWRISPHKNSRKPKQI